MSDWTREARCRDEDPEVFFPIGEFARARLALEEARRICMQCTVVIECLGLALATGSEHGVWGATTPDERRRMAATARFGQRGRLRVER